jgi:hypothetical protein
MATKDSSTGHTNSDADPNPTFPDVARQIKADPDLE